MFRKHLAKHTNFIQEFDEASDEEKQEVIAEYDSYSFEGVTREASGQQMQRVDTAIDSFNIEDLVKVAEDFVDAKVQIDHLKNGGKGNLRYTKELAVITRTEGVVWIKHCLYGI